MKKYIFILMALCSLMLVSCSGGELEAGVESADSDCPYEVGPGITMESVTLEASNVVFTASCDESIYNMDLLQKNCKEAKSAIIKELKSTKGSDAVGMNELIALLRESDKGLLYRYVGSSSGKEVKIQVSHSELQ